MELPVEFRLESWAYDMEFAVDLAVELRSPRCVSRVTLIPEDDSGFGHSNYGSDPKTVVFIVVAELVPFPSQQPRTCEGSPASCRRVAERETGLPRLKNGKFLSVLSC